MKPVIAAALTALVLLAAAPAQATEPARPVVVVKVKDGGFSWTDALIGAGAFCGLAIGLSGLIALYRRDHDAASSHSRKEET